MYKFLLPLFALAILMFGCSKPAPTPAPDQAFSGEILKGKHSITIKTSMGDIRAELDANAAPKTVTNFIELVKSGYYDNLTFHRVIPDFMIQGGDPNGNGTGGESIFGGEFEDEINAESYNLHKTKLKDTTDEALPKELSDMTMKTFLESQGYVFNGKLKSLPMKYGYLAMANSGPNTNGSQFFIIQSKDGVPWLEGKHTVFGKVTKGMDTVDAIANVPRDGKNMPLKKVTFTVETEK